MGTIYINTSGSATNSGSNTGSPLAVTVDASYAGGTTIQLSGTPDLSAVVTTAGDTQDAVFFTDATNSNRKIFWITAKDNVSSPRTITADTAPTGLTAGTSTGNIGGRQLSPNYNPIVEAALRAGDQLFFENTPAARATTYLTTRTNGDSTSGQIVVRGPTLALGTAPTVTLNVTSTPNVITGGSNTAWTIQDLVLDQDGASGDAVSINAGGWLFKNVKIIDCGGSGINLNGGIANVIGCEITGCGAAGIVGNTSPAGCFSGNYIHDNTTHGISLAGTASPNHVITNNLIDSNAGKGISLAHSGVTTQGHSTVVVGNTVYGNGDSGLEIADADMNVFWTNNIFSTNTNQNVKWAAGTGELHGYHGYNVFYVPSGTNLTNVTANSTEITTDPLMSNPAAGDFTIPFGSPAKAAGYPGQFMGASLGYRDIGAVEQPSVHFAGVIGG